MKASKAAIGRSLRAGRVHVESGGVPTFQVDRVPIEDLVGTRERRPVEVRGLVEVADEDGRGSGREIRREVHAIAFLALAVSACGDASGSSGRAFSG